MSVEGVNAEPMLNGHKVKTTAFGNFREPVVLENHTDRLVLWGKSVWTNDPESSSKVSAESGIGS